MSRWAERFTALSRSPDTIDTCDTRSRGGNARPSVSNCQSVHDKRSAVSSTPKTAESLDLAKGGGPFVNCVASVSAPPAEKAGPVIAKPKPLPTVLTEGDTRSAADTPSCWAEGCVALRSMPPPAEFYPERWQRIVDAAGIFLDRWATEAIRHGWTTLDLFGVDAGAPTARFDCMGLVMLLDRREILAIDERGADLVTASGARRRFRRRPMPPGTISLWELAQ
jgi:hypothetical protein